MLQDYEYEFDEILEQVQITGKNSEANNTQNESLRQQSPRQQSSRQPRE